MIAEPACLLPILSLFLLVGWLTGSTIGRMDVTFSDKETPVVFDGDNSYPGCEQCGRCCHLNVIAVLPEEVARVRAYMREHDVVPRDRRREACCLQGEDGRCMVWEARPQICRLHHCRVPRWRVVELNPQLRIPADPPLIDLHACFIDGDGSDPRYR